MCIIVGHDHDHDDNVMIIILTFQVVNAGKSRALSRLGSAFSSVAAQKLVYKVKEFSWQVQGPPLHILMPTLWCPGPPDGWLRGSYRARREEGGAAEGETRSSILFQEHLVRENHHCFKNGGKEGPRNKEKHKVIYLQYLWDYETWF